MALPPRLRELAVRVHHPIARRDWVAKRYLGVLGFMAKRVQDGQLKGRVVNLLRSVPWHDMPLRDQLVSVASDVHLRIVPHVGEFDFDALFWRSLRYEDEVFSVLRSRIQQYDSILEIGANIGLYTVFFSKALAKSGGHVFAFEPSRKAFLRLCENVNVNRLSNVSVFNCAVGSATGFVRFFEPAGHLTNGSLNREFAKMFSDRVEQRPVITLDGQAVSALITRRERMLVKVDVEGAEAEVLRSLEPLILDHRPDIVLEVLPGYAEQLDRLEFIRANYRFFSITSAGLVLKTRFEAIDAFRDYLLLPNASAN